MDEQQAIEQKDALNEIIKDYLNTISYVVFSYWNTQYEKLYATALIPYQYIQYYEAADYSQKLAFARVSLKTLVQNYKDADDFVSIYDIEAANDTELYNYLKG